jgi:hypothetical protein
MSIGLITAIGSLSESFWAAQAVTFGIAYWSLSLGLNIIITVAIAGRLFYMRSKLRNALGDQPLASPYISVAAMIIESASLYTSTALIFIVLYARGSPVQNYVLPVLGQVQVSFVSISISWVNAGLTLMCKGHRSSFDRLPSFARQGLGPWNSRHDDGNG